MDAAVFAAAGISHVSVRAPKIFIVAAREDLRLTPAIAMIARDCAARGAVPILRSGLEVDDALRLDDCDAIVIVGGSGTGARDRSVLALGARGQVAVHGVGIAPGETTASGNVGSRPVMILPGRLDGALAGWLVLGRRLLARLAGQAEPEATGVSALSRKITSTVGLAEVVPVRCDNDAAEPLAIRNLPLWALARANAKVAINTWP
jgi:molybdopterin biosynthesis enzyme